MDGAVLGKVRNGLFDAGANAQEGGRVGCGCAEHDQTQEKQPRWRAEQAEVRHISAWCHLANSVCSCHSMHVLHRASEAPPTTKHGSIII